MLLDERFDKYIIAVLNGCFALKAKEKNNGKSQSYK
jgi:hypothetical protein